MRIEGNDQRLAAATAVQVQQTGVQQMLIPKAAHYQDAKIASSSNTVQSITGDKVSINVELPQHNIDTLQRIGNTSDILNAVATNLRQTYEGLTAASAVVEKMKVSLNKVIKDYPPYPIEDQGRRQELMSYSSLQKEISQMMIPPPVPPVYDKVQHLWTSIATSGSGNTIQTPSVPQDVPVTHIKAAAKQLDFISGQINLVQETMINSVKTA